MKPDKKSNHDSKANTADSSDREFVITRILKAPRELVFKVWTDPKHVAQWWGPNGFTNTIHSMDVRPGGIFRLTMHGPDGKDYPNQITYKEVVKPERLIYLHSTDDEDRPGDFVVTVTFEDLGAKTKLTMRAVFKSAAAFELVVKEYGALEGGNQHVDRLEAYLAKMV